MRHRTTAAAAAFLAVGLVLTACGSDDKSDGAGKEIIVNSFGGDWEKAFVDAVVTPFEKETGAKVKLVVAYSADAMTQLTAAKDNPPFDVVLFSGGQEAAAAKDGMLVKLADGDLSNAKDLAPQALEGLARGEGPVVQISPMGIMYRTDKISTAPTSWKDIEKAEFAKHLALTDFSNTYGLYSMLGLNSAMGGDLNNVKPGLDAMTALAKSGNAIVVKTSGELQQAFSARDIWIAPYAQDYSETLRKAGVPVEFVVPTEGSPAAWITANVVAKRPNTDLAKKFVDFQLKPDVQLKLAQTLLYSPSNTKTEIPADLAKRVISGDGLKSLTRYPADTINSNRKAWTEAWNQGITR